MNIQVKVLAATLALTVSAFASAVAGESSDPNSVSTKYASTALPFGAGKAALQINNSSIRINIGDGPVKHINKKYGGKAINGNNFTASVDGLAHEKYLTIKDVNPVLGFFNNDTLGRVWYEKRAQNVDVYSVRQLADPRLPIAPKFGGLVIGQVKNLSDGSGVYFGEWAPRKNNTIVKEDPLGLKDPNHTVWFAGDNPTGRTQGLANVTYDVVGINQHVPGQNDFYRGKVTAKFGTTPTGSMSGAIVRGNDRLSFDKAVITNSTGKFEDTAQGMKGQFFGRGAEAMAGIAERGTADRKDDIAFGGRKQ
ncbi:Slam-dependent surface lipoprotein [Neisseria sp. WLZKY-1]|uniref:Slam-dependent surface lipoprotein n=1 Tax=Neisseria sp. WLZKY-1 TaxID=3390377 RepID=UPI003978A4E9